LANLKSEITRIRKVHISRIKQLEDPNVYLCRQCQNLLKNKKKLEDELLKASKTIESRLLLMEFLPESTRLQAASSSDNPELRKIPPDTDVIVSQLNLSHLNLPCAHRCWLVIRKLIK